MIEKKLAKAEALADINRHAEAVKIFIGCYAEEPDNLRVLGGLSDAFVELGDLENAFKYAREAVSHYPEMFESYLLISKVYLAEKNYPQAIVTAEKSLKIQPENPLALYVLFVSYFYTQDFAHARRILQFLEEIEPSSDLVFCCRGQLYLEDKNFDLAEKNFRRSLKINPENSDAMHNLALTLLHHPTAENDSRQISEDAEPTYAEEYLFTYEQQKQAVEHFFTAAKMSPTGEAAEPIKAFVRFPPIFSIVLFLVFLTLSFLLPNSEGITACFVVLVFFFLLNILLDLKRYAVYLKLKRNVAPEIRMVLRAGEREFFSVKEILRNGSVETFAPIVRFADFVLNIKTPIFRWFIQFISFYVILMFIGLVIYFVRSIINLLSS